MAILTPVHVEKFHRARALARKNFPYLTVALYAMTPHKAPGLGTMAVDKWWRLYVDPDLSWSEQEMSTVLVHEVGHLLRDHHGRADDIHVLPSEALGVNVAQDCEINDDLIATHLPFPNEPCSPQKSLGMPDGLLWEEYWAKMRDQMEKAAAQCPMCQAEKAAQKAAESGEGQGGEGQEAQQGQGEGQGQAGQGAPSSSASSSKGAGQGAGGAKGAGSGGSGTGPLCPGHSAAGQPGSGNCGSGAHGIPQPYELPAPQAGPSGKLQGGVSQADSDLIKRQVAAEIQEHSRSRGTVPGGYLRWANATLRPMVDWRKQLRTMVKRCIAMKAGIGDYTHQRPSRRQSISPDIILAGQRKPVPELAVVVDTSGSMSEAMLDRILGELKGILAITDNRGVEIISVDAAVSWHGRVSSAKQVKLAGGGGTDMRIGIEYARTLKPRPNVVVVATDGYTPWPDAKPVEFGVVVALTDEASRNQVPSWMPVVNIPPIEKL